MDKAILKKFAIESRKDLMEKIKNKINAFYIDEEFKKEQKGEIYVLSNEKHSLSLTNEEYQKRELLIKRIKELSLEQVIEEAAYTWFNRIIAIRYMEINDYLPLTKDNQSLGIRVLSSKDNTPDPEILKFSNLINPDLDIDFKKEKYIELKDNNEKFKYILLLVCKKLGKVIPQVFDGVTDYIDILIPDNLLNDTGFITKVINEVPENNYSKVEIIGWLYQYYNQLEKDRVIASRRAYKKNEIPYATQLFTPDWIVKYMVENSLGKYWVEHNGEETLSSSLTIIENWKYFIKENVEIGQKEKLEPTEITFIDPCCGSGHILVYAFDILYQIYSKSGYNKSDIPELILKYNLYGIDIDDRAGQLSILSVLLKAREYDKNIFNKDIGNNINIVSIQDSSNIKDNNMLNLCDNNIETLNYLIDKFKDGKEIGSLLLVDEKDYAKLTKELVNDNTIFGIDMRNKVLPLIKQAQILSKKYDIVVTNPPYLNSSAMDEKLKNYINKNFENYKFDTFSAFMIRNTYFGKKDAYFGFMTPNVWMFISSYEELRIRIINDINVQSFVQLAQGSFFKEATVDICTFVLKNGNSVNSVFYKLSEQRNGVEGQQQAFLDNLITGKDKYIIDTKLFENVPGSPMAFWLTPAFFNLFKRGKPLGEIANIVTGMSTGNNNSYLRFWYEVNFNNIEIGADNIDNIDLNHHYWIPYNKGGEARKWYGNNEYVVKWSENAKFHRPRYTFKNLYLKEGITWSFVTTGMFSARYYEEGFLWDVAGSPCVIDNNKLMKYVLAFLSTNVAREILKFINPTINCQVVDMQRLPIIEDKQEIDNIAYIANQCIEIVKKDWDSFENSWNFKKHPLLDTQNNDLIKNKFLDWSEFRKRNFNILKEYEYELNKKFIKIYELNNDMRAEVENKTVTYKLSNLEREIKSLISYAVGCMFGRYSLDKEGLIYAGGDFDEIYKKHKKTDGGWAGVSLSNYKVLNDNGQEIDLSFEVDNDNVIPITDEAYFSDDIVERFKTFISVVYGEKTLNENLDFIAETLGKKGTETSEDTIRRYFVNDFFNDHVKTYQKRPIYWLFDSGKKNGFKALVYMHRYNENLIPKVRLDYLHRMQTTYEKLLVDVNDKLTSELSMTDKKEAQKRQADLNAKLQEIKEYDEKIAHIANQRISIDLDDGVKVNYDKFKDILAKIK